MIWSNIYHYRQEENFWERRILFHVNESGPHYGWGEEAEAVESLDALKIAKKPEMNDELWMVNYELNANRQEFVDTVNRLDEEAWVDSAKLYLALGKIQPEFQKKEENIILAQSLHNLIQYRRGELWSGKIDSRKSLEKTLTQEERTEMSRELVQVLGNQQEADGMSLIPFSDEVLNEFYNEAARNKGEGEDLQTYLSAQLENPNSQEAALLIRGYDEIVQKLEANAAEKPLIHELINSLGEPYSHMAGNENLQNMISRDFDLVKNETGNTVLIRTSKPGEIIQDQHGVMTTYLKTELPNWEEHVQKTGEVSQTLVNQIEHKNGVQENVLQKLKANLKELHKEGTEAEESFGKMIKTVFEWFCQLSDEDWEGANRMLIGLKIEETTSQTDQFSMSYQQGEEVDSEDVFVTLKGQKVKIHEGTAQEEEVEITKAEQVKIIQDSPENGKVDFQLVSASGEWGVESGEDIYNDKWWMVNGEWGYQWESKAQVPLEGERGGVGSVEEQKKGGNQEYSDKQANDQFSIFNEQWGEETANDEWRITNDGETQNYEWWVVNDDWKTQEEQVSLEEGAVPQLGQSRQEKVDTEVDFGVTEKGKVEVASNYGRKEQREEKMWSADL